MTAHVPDIPDDPHDAAAYWFTREHGGLMTPDERLRFESWRMADPCHEHAFQDMMRVWGIAQATPNSVFEHILQPPRSSAATVAHPRRRRMLALGVGSACCTLAAAWLLTSTWPSAPSFSARYASQHGERHTFDLPDGSKLTLNTDSVAEVRFYTSERRVLLQQGEAFFAVAPAAERPFVVEAGLAIITVTGTEFNIRRNPQEISVIVRSGSVAVANSQGGHQHTRRLGAAQSIRLSDKAVFSDITPINPDAATAWRNGKVVFDDAPLATVVAEMNRYRHSPIRLQSTTVGEIRVAGVFSTEDQDSFLDVLPALAPVIVLRRPDGRSEIVAR